MSSEEESGIGRDEGQKGDAEGYAVTDPLILKARTSHFLCLLTAKQQPGVSSQETSSKQRNSELLKAHSLEILSCHLPPLETQVIFLAKAQKALFLLHSHPVTLSPVPGSVPSG